MNLYAFELGRKKDLCHAELIAVLGQKAFVEKNLDTSIFRLTPADLSGTPPSPSRKDFQHLQDQLGGTIKIIQIFAQLPIKSQESSIEPKVKEYLEEIAPQLHGKVAFAVSLLGYKNPREFPIKPLLNFSKKILKSFGLNSRFVNKNFQNAKPSTIYKARVLEKGIDLCVIRGNENLFLGRTVAIQNIDNYSLRDYEKPRRDAKIGMLPPKLAQIMLNLGATDAKTIYDPFCGTGTILTEAMLTDKTVVGSDINPRMVEFSEKNCQWLNGTFHKQATFHIFLKDATKISKADLPVAPDAIVTESFLGEAISHTPDPQKRRETFTKLRDLHNHWLKAAHSLLPPHAHVTLCLPFFRLDYKKTETFPDFGQLAKNCGYKILQSFLYDREDQLVGREIVLLEKI